MKYLLLLFHSLAFASPEMLPFDEAVKKCDSYVRWGYYLQDLATIKKLGGRIDNWRTKDLTGKFNSLEECNKARGKNKNPYLAEECQMFSVGETEIAAAYYFAEARQKRDLNLKSVPLTFSFKSKAECEKAVKSGGEFKDQSGTLRTVAPNGSDKQVSFVSDCKEEGIILCEKQQTTADIAHFNN